MPAGKYFREKIRRALDNPFLRSALENLAAAYPKARALAYQGIDFESLRDEIEQVKKKAVENIDNLARTFEERLRGRGASVHRARDGSEVIEIIKGIARRRGARLCVKSKSMASEEIHLNENLKDVMQVVETDLGEWLIQQIEEKPSHIVMPAIHLTKEKCADIFSRVVGYEVKADIPEAVALARRILRKYFLEADIGISGCNIAVAQTGTMVIFTNEGNGRLTSTLPPVHIILVGYEKLVSEFKDIAPLARALPRSATGQVITSYITMISAPGETPAESQGNQVVPRELHVILLDNGRLHMLKDPVFKEIGQCLRCASCLNICPVYQLLSGQVYGHIYTGGIGALLTAFLNSPQEAEKIEGLCLSCGCCRQVCPAKIDIPGLTLKMRARIRGQIPGPFMHSLLVGKMMPHKRALHLALKSASPGSRIAASRGGDGHSYIKSLPFGLRRMVAGRYLPALAKVPFRDMFKEIHQDICQPRQGRVAFFAGCLVDYVYPEIGEAVVRVLNKEGYEILFPDQTCCGAPALYTGFVEAARRMARQNLKFLAYDRVDYIVTPCPTCTKAFRNFWKELLEDDPAAVTHVENAAAKTLDFINVLCKLKNEKPPLKEAKHPAERKIRITYHHACHLETRAGLLSLLPGFEWVDLEEADRCCGFAGAYSFKYPEISAELLRRKIERIEASGAGIAAVDCPGCLLHLRGGLAAKSSPLRVYHSAELLAKQ